MATRALIKFYDEGKSEKPRAVIYRSMNGYPEELGRDLITFVEEIRENALDFRFPGFDDAPTLAARWIVYDSIRYIKYDALLDKRNLGISKPKKHYLSWADVAIVDDKSDYGAEFQYKVICDGKPTLLLGDKKLEKIVEKKESKKGEWFFSP